MRLRLIILFLLCCVLGASAQKLRDNPSAPAERKETRIAPRNLPPLTPKSWVDTVYCVETKKQHGWFGPLTILTPEQVRHRSMSVMFTNRDAEGHWRKMEIIDSRGRHVGGVISPYILSLNSAEDDSEASKEWVERLQTACVFEFVPGPSGGSPIQERAYDEKGNVIYIFSRTPIGRNKDGRRQYVGSYRDFYGLPAEMRPDTTKSYTYGTLVMLTEDRWGNDSIVEYMDARGNKRLNDNAVAMSIYVYDKHGYLLANESRDADGKRVMDNCGNCGTTTYWKDGYKTAHWFMDDRWQPMILPPGRDRSSENDGVAGIYNEYDRYGRMTSRVYLDIDSALMARADGVARVELDYDEYGEQAGQRHYGLDGRPHNSREGFALQRVTRDEAGHVTAVEWLDENGRPNPDNNFLSRREMVYDGDKQIVDRRFEGRDGKHEMVYEYRVTPDAENYYFSDGSTRVDSLDSKARTTMIVFRDSTGHLEKVGYRAMEIATYRDFPHGSLVTEAYFDADSLPTYDDNHRVRTVGINDSITGTYTQWDYLADDVPYNTFMKVFTPDFSKIIGQYDCNIFGKPCRAGGASWVRHYYARALNSQKGAFTTLAARDEFDEPDYLSYDDGTIYYYTRLNGQNFDEDNNLIEYNYKFRRSVPKTLTIEVTDSVAYRLGLRDNDVIIADGEYVDLPAPNLTEDDFRAKRIFAMHRAGDAPRRIIVFRVDSATREYGLVALDGIRGIDSRNGFLAHTRFLTRRQDARIREACLASDLLTPDMTYSAQIHHAHTGDKEIIMMRSEMYRGDRSYYYPAHVVDPSVPLAIAIPEYGLSWKIGDPTATLEYILGSRKASRDTYPEMVLWLTRDGHSVERFATRDQYLRMRVYTQEVNDSIWAHYLDMGRQPAVTVHDELTAARVRLPRGTYILDSEPDTQWPGNLTVTVDKKGFLHIRGEMIGGIAESNTGFVYRATIDSGDTDVELRGNILSLSTHATLRCVDVIGFSDELHDQAVEYANGELDDDTDEWENMLWLTPGLSADICLRRLDDGSYAVEDNRGRRVKLKRIK